MIDFVITRICSNKPFNGNPDHREIILEIKGMSVAKLYVEWDLLKDDIIWEYNHKGASVNYTLAQNVYETVQEMTRNAFTEIDVRMDIDEPIAPSVEEEAEAAYEYDLDEKFIKSKTQLARYEGSVVGKVMTRSEVNEMFGEVESTHIIKEIDDYGTSSIFGRGLTGLSFKAVNGKMYEVGKTYSVPTNLSLPGNVVKIKALDRNNEEECLVTTQAGFDEAVNFDNLTQLED